MKEKYLIDCCYLSKLRDEIIAEVKYNGKIYRGTLTEVVK
jgi:hypothetical protein